MTSFRDQGLFTLVAAGFRSRTAPAKPPLPALLALTGRGRYRARPMADTTLTQPKVGIVSLGCPKALVDSERIITRLRAEGYQIAPDYKDADLVLVNTCGFLDSARDESLEAIGEALNENGKVI